MEASFLLPSPKACYNTDNLIQTRTILSPREAQLTGASSSSPASPAKTEVQSLQSSDMEVVVEAACRRSLSCQVRPALASLKIVDHVLFHLPQAPLLVSIHVASGRTTGKVVPLDAWSFDNSILVSQDQLGCPGSCSVSLPFRRISSC